MKKIFLIFCFIITVANASFLDSWFGNNSNKQHRRHKQASSSTTTIDMNKESAVYRQYCQTESTGYGFKIKCSMTNVVAFKANESSAVKCAETINGVGSYPSPVILNKVYLNSLNSCKGEIFGPNTLKFANVEKNGTDFLSKNISVTYYDIVCNSSIGYESTQYIVQQKSYNDTKNKAVLECQEINAPEPKKFIIMFYICIGLALVSLGVVLYKKYKNKQ